MADMLHITPDQVRVRANQFRVQANDLNELIMQMDEYMSLLTEEWVGQSSTAFMTTFQEIRPGFVQAEEMLLNIASILDTNADQFETVDKNLANQIN